MTTPDESLARIGARLREELFDFLRIPSVSARSEHREDVRRAADWVGRHLRATGFETEVVDTPGHPVVLGEWKKAGPGAPTLLIYGHYDVQPAEPLDLWTSPPFEPEIRDGRLYARGATDDKGQLYLHLKALELLMGSEGRLPVNVVVVAEGEEEIGSPSLLPFLRDYRDRLDCDAVIISDSQMFAPGVPSLLSSLRGLAYVEIHVQGARSDLHSGAYGGAVPNAATVLARLLASLHDADGRVAIPGFYDRVAHWDAEARAAIGGLPFDEEGFREETGAPGLQGEAGYGTLERLWIRPTCEVNGLLSGYTGEGAKTVLPARAMAKVSFRLVPDQDPDEIPALLRRHLQAVAPPQVRVEVRELHHGRPWRGAPEGPVFEAARRALTRSFGREPVLTGEGGSIPIVSDFEKVLGAPVLLLGFGLPGSNLHAPDEWFPDAHLEKGIETLLYLYEELEG